MSSDVRLFRLAATVALSLVCLALVAACGSSSPTSSGGTPSATAPTSPTTSTPTAGTEHPPSSCSEIPVSLLSAYIGDVVTTTSLGPLPSVLQIRSGVSCSFASAGSTKAVVVNIGQGNESSFTTLRAATAGGGRTLTPISGLGSSAFSISVNGAPGGVDAVTTQNVVFVVASLSLTIAQDEALIRQLMQLF
jgi:hypothetical protein